MANNGISGYCSDIWNNKLNEIKSVGQDRVGKLIINSLKERYLAHCIARKIMFQVLQFKFKLKKKRCQEGES